MRFKWLVVLGLPALVAITPALAHAADRIWIQGSVGAASYKMDDVNANIASINTVLARSGFSVDELTDGVTYGGAIGFDMAHGLSVGLAYERLEGKVGFDDPFAALTYDLPADLYRVFGRYTFGSALKTQGFLEASAGRVSPAGSISYREVGQIPFHGELGNSGLALEGASGAQRWLAPWLALNAALGYRYAVVDHTLLAGAPLQDMNGGEYSIDYSGMFLRAGLTVLVSH